MNMVDLDYWGDLALRTWVNVNPSPHWANQFVERWRGLPFGAYLHAARPTRQRTLTGPLNPAGASLWHKMQVYSSLEPEQRTDEQAQCGFLSKLPIDIRLIIYEMVLGGMLLHVSATPPRARIVHHVCQAPPQQQQQAGAHGGHHICSDTRERAAAAPARERFAHATGLLPLLVTCRRIYSEAIHTLYSGNTFEFTQNMAAFTFLKHMIPPQRLRALRHFRLHLRIPRHPAANARATRDWADLWRFFAADMPGLRALYLELQMLQPVEAQIEATCDDSRDADAWMRPVVLMALAAAGVGVGVGAAGGGARDAPAATAIAPDYYSPHARRRAGCRVELVTRRVVHEPAVVFRELAGANPAAAPDELVRMTCAALHYRIRTSLAK